MTENVIPLVRKRLDEKTIGKNRFKIIYVEEDEDEPDLDEVLRQALAKGLELNDGEVAPVVSRSIFGSLQKAHDDEEGEGFLYARIMKVPCL